MGTPQRRPAPRWPLLTRVTLLLATPTLLGALVATGPSSSGGLDGLDRLHVLAPPDPGRPRRPAVDTLRRVPPAGAFVVPGPARLTASRSRWPPSRSRVLSRSSTAAAAVSTSRCRTTASARKANSPDFLIRAYYIRPHFKTARGGSGTVDGRRLHLVPGSRQPDRRSRSSTRAPAAGSSPAVTSTRSRCSAVGRRPVGG